MHEKLANATFRIQCGNSSGSGFSYISDKYIITNHHVIEHANKPADPIQAITESGTVYNTKLVSSSVKTQYDYAVLELVDNLPSTRTVLQPAADMDHTPRGKHIVFSGFPHGIHDLLVHEAIVSAPFESKGFYIDGSVNGGNSGGPIVESELGTLVGIVTQRRFMGGQYLQGLSPKLDQLAAHCQAIKNQGSVAIMGIDFGQFAGMMATGFQATSQVIQANANSGIGIGFNASYVTNELNGIIQGS